ncbi:MAG TPA: type II 3-dehydroquinate dehydratase [Candidatus Acidoferrum sp.]|nr:type II 3-dehydroquinate dehydratase [Candidatus Acidoferrum sp.]
MVINGPNLNLLGRREPGIYGTGTYPELVAMLETHAAALGAGLVCRQSNHEGDLVDWIQEAGEGYDGIVLNPAACTHTSVALLDAVKAVGVPTVEVHISDVSKREAFRQVSYVGAACVATIKGRGFQGYLDAMDLLAQRVRVKST